MTDYSQMSDQQINDLVDSHIYDDIENAPDSDYCNNPADAWPIITEQKINIEWHEWKNREWKPHALNNATGKSCYDSNPLRAAMICFLMIQESSNANPI